MLAPEFALPTAVAADRAVRTRAAAEVVAVPEGLVIRHPRLHDVHYVNAILLDRANAGSRPKPGHILAMADRWQGGLAHRHVVFNDDVAGERAAAALRPYGWERRRTLYMALSADPGTALSDPRAREISEAEMDALQFAGLREEVPEAAMRSGLADRLAATQRALRAGTPARCFGAGEDGGLQSMCTLFLDPDVAGAQVAMIEEVGTLLAHRRRGLARAVVGAAIRAAAAWGAQLIVVPADADDWPQLMYASMGFEPLGLQVALTLRTGSGNPSV